MSVLQLAALDDGEVFREILLYRCKVHLVQTNEIGAFGVLDGFRDKTQERSHHIFLSVDTADIADEVG